MACALSNDFCPSPHTLLHELIERRIDIQQTFTEVYVASMQLFPLDTANKIILKSLTRIDIAEFAVGKIIHFFGPYPKTMWDISSVLYARNTTVALIEKHIAIYCES